jgi:hypothetical protein
MLTNRTAATALAAGIAASAVGRGLAIIIIR